MPAPLVFPSIAPKPHLRLEPNLPGQIYTLDGFLSPAELEAIGKWTRSIHLEDPTKPGKGQAERTARRGSLDSPEIAQIILDALEPHLASLDPPYTPKTPLLSPNIRVYHYPTGTIFRAHYDSPMMDQHSRRLSCWTVLVYLSPGVSGGGTTFWPDDAERDSGRKRGTRGKKDKPAAAAAAAARVITVAPTAGRLLLHWHGVARGGCMLHQGDEVTRGDKWVLRTDVLA